MKNQLSFLVFTFWTLFFVSCQPNKNQVPVAGSLDSVAIAGDTVMQKGIEASYEYSKSLTVNDTLVYDIRAFGGPASSGEFAILRRAADNKADTMAKGEREGTIVNSFVADLNHNQKEEVYIITQSGGSGNYGNIIAYEFSTSAAVEIKYNEADESDGHDSFYVDGQYLGHSFPVYKEDDKNCCPTGGSMSVFYKLEGTELKVAKRKRKN